MSQNSTKIMKLKKENGIFIFFVDYEYEEEFPYFLDFLKSRLDVISTTPEELPYSTTAALNVDDKYFTAVFEFGTRCFIRLETELDAFADEIIKKCTVQQIPTINL